MLTDEFEKEMEKQDEGDVLTCDDLSQDMVSVSPDHPLLGSASSSFVVGTSEPLDVDRFIHQFMQKNLGEARLLQYRHAVIIKFNFSTI